MKTEAFFCDCADQNRQRKPRKQNNMAKDDKDEIINVADVLDIKPGDNDDPAWINGTLECVVTKVKEASGKGPVKATLCHAEDDGVKITANFWKWDFDDVEKLEGKLVRMSGGMTRTDYKPKQGPRIQQVSITSKTEIEVVAESAHSEKPLPHKASEDRDTPRTQQKAQEREEMASQPVTDTDRRAKCYFGVFFSVEKAYREAKEAGLKTELSATDLKDITTGISLTYRGAYGSYMEPLFPKREKPKFSEGMSDEDIPFEEPKPVQSTEKKAGWKSFKHPKTGVPLGECGDAKLVAFARWAVESEPDSDDENRPFWEAIQEMMKDKKWLSPVKVLVHSFLNHPGYGVKFEDDDINGYLNREFDSSLDDISDEDATTAIENFSDLTEAVEAIAEKRKSKKPKKPEMPD